APAVPPAGLPGAADGSLTWTGAYDAAYGRFAWHDPLDDLQADPKLGGALPGGPFAGRATYLVVGWWSDAGLDPLDEVRTEGGLAERLGTLAWRLLPGAADTAHERQGALERANSLGLAGGGRWKVATATSAGTGTVSARAFEPALSLPSLAAEARTIVPGRVVGAEASTLLHGALVGVPVQDGIAAQDLRPATTATNLALGDSLDELVATLAASGMSLAGDERATLERLLAAFNARLLPQLGSADGLADIDEARHAAAFTSVDP
ncbi:hypothetical protein SE17_39680, partial [Kouleothrix aurantiaca]